MFTKKTRCKVCGYRSALEKETVYTAEEPRAFIETLSKPPITFSAVDCPRCGCQIVLSVRAPKINVQNDAERDGKENPGSPYPDGDKSVLACPRCGSGEFLHNADEAENAYCGQCGQAIEWEGAE